MRVKRFNNGNINIKKDSWEFYTSFDSFVTMLHRKLRDELMLDVKRTSHDTLTLEGVDYTITYDILDDYNWYMNIKCKVWNKILTFNIY